MNTFAIVLGHISLCLILYDRTSQVALMVKNLPAKAGGARHTGLISGSRRSPGGGNGTPLQYSCLENPIDKGAWQATVHGVARVGHNLATKPPPPPEGSLPDGGRRDRNC